MNLSFNSKLSRKLNPISVYSKLVSFFFGFFLDWLEKLIITRHRKSSDKTNRKPVFIIGAPRSGSTLFYQILINELDVLYISNFTHVFFRWLNIGFALEKRFLNKKRNFSLTSNYGDTLKSGWGAPSEFVDFWDVKLPRNRHYATELDVTSDATEFFKNSIEVPMESEGKPFVFKNMHAGQRIKYIRAVLPDAKFIFISRELSANVQSIIKARLDIRGDKNAWWSIKPKEYSFLKEKDYLTQVVGQVYFIEQQIKKDFDEIPDQNKLTISYEQLCENPDLVLSDVADFTFGSNQNFKLQSPITLKKSSKNFLSKTEIDEIELIADSFKLNV